MFDCRREGITTLVQVEAEVVNGRNAGRDIPKECQELEKQGHETKEGGEEIEHRRRAGWRIGGMNAEDAVRRECDEMRLVVGNGTLGNDIGNYQRSLLCSVAENVNREQGVLEISK